MIGTETRSVLISGAGSGIGRAMAGAFIGAGYLVAALDVSQEGLAATEEAVGGGDLLSIQADVRSAPAILEAVASVIHRFGSLDVLCSNAGIFDDFQLCDEVSDDAWERVLGVNLTGAMILCRAALRPMLAAGRGAIILTGSIAAVRGGRAGAAYTASKHGVVGLARSIAASYGDRGIRCNTILPGSVRTPIAASASLSPQSTTLRDKVRSSRPAPAEPDAIAAIALFLASESSGYINGETLTADGGWTNY